jgi:uncharacterized damage-inducible protein DinB
MGNTGFLVSEKVEDVLNGSPWYGNAVMKGLRQVRDNLVTEQIGGAHSMAEILLHMVAWTEEAVDRLRGEKPKEPRRGDWPNPSERSWQSLIRMFEDANEELQATIRQVPEDKWFKKAEEIKDSELATGVNFFELIEGLLQHHIYHAGQIAILNKQFSTNKS